MGLAAVAVAESAVPGGPVAHLIDELRDAARALGDAADRSHDHEDLAVAAAQVASVGAMVDAALAAVIDASDRMLVAPRNGDRRLDRFLLANGNASGVEIRARIRRAKWLRDFPELGAAHAAGVLTVEHLEKIRKGLDNPRTHFLLRRDQSFFVETAMRCDFVDFGRACDYWAIAADPDGAEPREQVAATSFRAARRADGMVKLDGLLDPLSGQVFLSTWERATQQLAVDDHGTGVRRSMGQRGAVALLELVAKGSARSDGSHVDPLIHIVMSQAVAEDTLRRLVESDPSPLPVDPHDVDGRCELIDGTPIHPHLALTVLGIAALQRTVLDAKGRPLETSYPTRAFPRWLRHILMLRSRGRCESEGCDAPFPWLQIDHVHPHSRGGETAYGNAKVFCRPDNLAKGDSVQ